MFLPSVRKTSFGGLLEKPHRRLILVRQGQIQKNEEHLSTVSKQVPRTTPPETNELELQNEGVKNGFRVRGDVRILNLLFLRGNVF